MSGHFETTPERDLAEHSSRSVMWLLGNMILVPIRAFIHGMELLVKSMQGMQDATDRSLEVIAGKNPDRSNDAATMVNPVPVNAAQPVPLGSATAGMNPATTNIENNHETSSKESANMPDTNLSDDMLKLVRYKVLFIKRDYEWAFPEREELVFDNMTDSAFTAWKIAEFIQSLNRIEVPHKWREKTPPYPPHQEWRNVDGRDIWVIHSLPESDKKFFRIYFEVLQRYAREKLKYEEDQLEALRGIRDAIEKKGISPGPGTVSGAEGTHAGGSEKRGRAPGGD